MTAINRQPGGLLGLLGIKNGGQYPRDLSNILLPVWDVSGLYCADAYEYTTTTINVTATGTTVMQGPVPGEVWFITEFGARTGNLLAGESFNGGLGIMSPNSGVYVPVSGISALSTTPNRRFHISSDRPFYLKPGESLCVFCTDVTTAGNIPLISSARFTRLAV